MVQTQAEFSLLRTFPKIVCAGLKVVAHNFSLIFFYFFWTGPCVRRVVISSVETRTNERKRFTHLDGFFRGSATGDGQVEVRWSFEGSCQN